MPEDDENMGNETDDQFVGIVNSNDWESEKTWQFKIVENAAFVGIMTGIVCGVALALGAVIWVWKQIL